MLPTFFGSLSAKGKMNEAGNGLVRIVGKFRPDDPFGLEDDRAYTPISIGGMEIPWMRQ